MLPPRSRKSGAPVMSPLMISGTHTRAPIAAGILWVDREPASPEEQICAIDRRRLDLVALRDYRIHVCGASRRGLSPQARNAVKGFLVGVLPGSWCRIGALRSCDIGTALTRHFCAKVCNNAG